MTVGICKVKSNGTSPDNTSTFDNVASSTACRDRCLINELCTGYQWITNANIQLKNCAAFTETQVVEGNGDDEDFECYFV